MPAPHNITNPHVAILDNTSNNTNDSNTADQDHHLLMDPERRHQDQEQGHPGRSAVATALPSEPYSTLTDGEHPLIGWAHRRWSHQSPGSSSPKVDSSTIDKLSGSLENTDFKIKFDRHLSNNNNSNNTPSQLSLGFNPCKKTNMNPPTSILSSSVPKGLPTPSTTPSTPPKRQMSLSWNLPPGHPKEISTSSQSSTHALSSAVPILPVTSADGQDHQATTNNSHTPNIPFNRYRSKSFSSSVGSEDSFGSTFSGHRSNSLSTTPLVTSSSYSSLPYSPAVAFLSNFVDVTAPKISLDEEGAQATSIQMDESGQVERVAVKIVKTQTGAADNDRVQKMLRKEIAIWSQISHPHVLPFLSVEELPTDTFIFCELCTGGHLLNYLSLRSDSLPQSTTPTTPGSAKPLEEDEARVIFNQVAEAVRYLHEEKRIVHRDIKLENVLRHEDGTWKICDFGLAEYQDEEAAACFGESLMTPADSVSTPFASPKYDAGGTTPVKTGQEEKKLEEEDICGGSLAYSSPEQLRSHKPLRCPSSDVWSLGVVLYALLTGRLPFQDEYEPRLQYQILNGRYEDPAECSAEARDLLKNMFRSKPEERWRVGQVKDSAWCKGITDHSLSVGGDFSTAGGAGGGGGGSSFLSSFRSTL
ncbi:hypothetical protein BGZ91_002583 [Linnemannia elongata]|nr:hypothetical protein BGZ91_002583 [Linnemannia elongata]